MKNSNRKMLQTAIGTAIVAGASAILLPPPAMATEIQKFASMKVDLRADGTPSFINASEMRGRLDGSAGLAERARSVVAHFGARFGLADAKTELVHERINTDLAGNAHVLLKQRFRGVPVEGSTLTVHFDNTGEPVSITGRFSPDLSLSVQADISEADAIASATQAVADAKPNANDLWSTGAQLVVYDPAALSAGSGSKLLAFKVTVRGRGVREFVYVDASNGEVIDRFTGIHEARDRLTYDTNNGTNYLAATLERSEGEEPVVVDLDIDNAHDFAGDTYDFMFNAYGRDSIDDSGFTLRSYTHYGVGYENAFWDGQRMTYGDGFPVDDVTGHEITHGVTEHTAGLIYRNQSGALNESFSDIFGEAIDLVNGTGDDSPAVRWLMGEEIPGIGAIRDMSNPPAFGHPDRVTSPLYYCGLQDSGGVHINSGVPNKNFVLMVDGGSFNGRDVRAIGGAKAAAIHYQSLTNYLGPSSTMRDHLIGLWRSCNDLIGIELDDPATGAPSGEIIARNDCFQVLKAGLAVELHVPVCP